MTVKVSLQQWNLPLTINVSLNGYEWKKLCRCSLDGVKTLIKKYQCEIFNSVDLCSGVGIMWSTTTGTRLSDATAVTFSVKRLNPLALYPLSGNIFRKWFASKFFIYSRAFHNNVISNSKSYCRTDIFYWRLVYIAAIKKYLRIQIIFMQLESAFH